MRFYEGATGLKTGTTDGAGSCLSATATRENLSLVAVVMGCVTSDDRFASARGLLDYGFANFTSVQPPSVDDQLVPVKVLRGVSETVELTYDTPGSFVIDKLKEDAITQQVTLTEDVEAPVVAGQVLGKVEVLVDGALMGQYDLKACADVERMTVWRALGKLTASLFDVGPRPTAAPESIGIIGEDAVEGDSSQPEAEKAPCECGEGDCYCDRIGDICGCTKTGE